VLPDRPASEGTETRHDWKHEQPRFRCGVLGVAKATGEILRTIPLL
jgi:hypothetical protein